MKIKLRVLTGPSAGKAIAMSVKGQIFGRSKESDVRIPEISVSRQHCRLIEEDGMVIVEDLGSTHGTRINSQKVEDRCAIKSGDELALGRCVFEVLAIKDKRSRRRSAGQTSDTSEGLEVGEGFGEESVFGDAEALGKQTGSTFDTGSLEFDEALQAELLRLRTQKKGPSPDPRMPSIFGLDSQAAQIANDLLSEKKSNQEDNEK